MTFLDGGVSIGTATISGTTATFTTSALAAGSHTITCSWPGNTNYNPATCSPITQVVNKATSTLSVATSGTPSTYGQPVTFTAKISSGPTGLVTFLDGGVSIGTATISGTTATFTTSALAAGSHTITASWVGNANYNAVTSSPITQVVNKATPTLSVATSGSPSTYGAPVTFTATISSGPTGLLTFLDGGVSIGTGAIIGTTATFATSTLTAGFHTITASWAGNANYNAVTSSPITQVVNNQVATPAFSVATGTYPAAQLVSLTDSTAAATIYYTTNGNRLPSARPYIQARSWLVRMRQSMLSRAWQAIPTVL